MIENQVQLKNTQEKLKTLEGFYEQTRQREASRARDASLRTLKRRINQLKEEIAVFEARRRPQADIQRTDRGDPKIEDRYQLENTRVKLQEHEEMYEQTKRREASRARDASLRSLKRTINQFKEEIAVYEAHQREDRAKSVAQAEGS